MRALHFAFATANLAWQSAFLFIATHFPLFIASSSASERSTRVWIPVLPLELLPHAAARCEDDRYEVYTKLLA